MVPNYKRDHRSPTGVAAVQTLFGVDPTGRSAINLGTRVWIARILSAIRRGLVFAIRNGLCSLAGSMSRRPPELISEGTERGNRPRKAQLLEERLPPRRDPKSGRKPARALIDCDHHGLLRRG